MCAWNADSQIWGQAQLISGVRRGRGSIGRQAVGAGTQTGDPPDEGFASLEYCALSPRGAPGTQSGPQPRPSWRTHSLPVESWDVDPWEP